MRKVLNILAFVFPIMVIGQTQTENYIKTTAYQDENQTKKIETITYFDGLGRSKQSIDIRAGGQKQDIITPIFYDQYGRQPLEYLPYASPTQSGNVFSNPINNLESFYDNPKYENTNNPYSEKKFEASPLSRLLRQGAPGSSWQVIHSSTADHSIKFEYDVNTYLDDKIPYFTIGTHGNSTTAPELVYGPKEYYSTGELAKTITKDENWSFSQTFVKDHTTEEYKDRMGRVVLKRTYNENVPHDTQYVYDRWGNLIFVLPPKVSANLFNVNQVEVPYTYNQYIERNEFLTPCAGSLSGGGNIRVFIENSVLQINCNAGFVSSKIDFNKTHPISAIHPIPNMNLGYLPAGGNSTRYSVLIENNELKFVDNDPSGPCFENISKTFTLNLDDALFGVTHTIEEVEFNEVVSEQCYQYVYDDRNRVIRKKTPGKGWENFVYDRLDRPVLSQDANLRENDEWLFTKYDIYGRVAYTGILSTTFSMNTLQENINNIAEPWVVRSNSTTAEVKYINHNYPPTSFTKEIFSVNYYDDYEVGSIIPFNPANGSSSWNEMVIDANAKGLPTVTRTKVLGEQDKWITTAFYYDDKGRVWETYLKNDFLEVEEWTLSKLERITGRILKKRSLHTKGSNPTIVTVDTYEYDHMGRLINQYQCVGDNSLSDECSGGADNLNITLDDTVISSRNEVARNSIILKPNFHVVGTGSVNFTASIDNGDGELIVQNHYDELGQMDYKKVGNKEAKPLQTVNYKYNIRGWLKQINDPNNLGADLFAFGIKYNNPDYNPVSRGLFNGNISETHWITANDNKNRNYRYEYDALNRITDAINIGTNEGHRYRVIDITYDKNGNIQGLNRNGWQNNGTYGNMDVLIYSYDNGNKLTKVVDNGNDDYGFKDGANTSMEYTYDANGNMKTDANKGITNITYNHLNLPTQVTINNGTDNGNIQYIYDATGVKLKKIVSTGTTTEYAGNYVYENSSLEFFNTSEGYFDVTGTPPSGELEGAYVYQYKDHLGNIRLSYSDTDGNGSINANTEIIEEKNYYPFGMLQKGYNNVVNGTAHPYGYNGKEEQEELGLDLHDYGARMYDAALGRWHATDNKAEFYFANSPYVYALNTPVNAIDPDGNLVIFINGLGGGGQNYWRVYEKVRIGVTLNRMGNEVPVYRNELRTAFDLNVSDQLGDHNRMYIDGSPGSIFNNFTSGQRFSQGYDAGLEQAASIIGSLARDPQGNIVETIKIVTHSMGGVYGKGFVAALKYYIKTSKDPQVRKALITLVADFDPFQAGGKLGAADENTYTQQFINSGWWDIFNAGWLANEEEEEADEVIKNKKKTSHFIDTFIGNIDQLQEGKYEWDDDKQEWICTTCKND